MGNRGFTTPDDRMLPDGPTGVQRLREAKDASDSVLMTAEYSLIPETVGCQFRRGGWDKYEIPTGNDGESLDGLHKFIVPGGDANMDGKHVVAAYPGGTVA